MRLSLFVLFLVFCHVRSSFSVVAKRAPFFLDINTLSGLELTPPLHIHPHQASSLLQIVYLQGHEFSILKNSNFYANILCSMFRILFLSIR
ncbi:hypothetical protein B0H63DRAFT_467361 [Podospora didyma]|uniref:Secreted protein n=1 Tax=Podospora didyma TaxID=330526 RepID=A0AAE0U4W0_9PEZI|nr:hypothetical protein B0H63DRAFT_467361 [Podospora didyma]